MEGLFVGYGAPGEGADGVIADSREAADVPLDSLNLTRLARYAW